MVVVTIFVVLPLSCQKHMRSLQNAAAAGMLVVAGLCALLAIKAVGAGMPAVASGEFKLWSLKVGAQPDPINRSGGVSPQGQQSYL